MAGRAELVRDLKSLRRGRGLYAGKIEERVGPALRAACGVSAGDGPSAIRQKVAARLTELVAHLPDHLRLATLAAFAVHAEARKPLYQDRVQWAAVRIDRDARTVRRRVDEAIDELADLATCTPHRQLGEPADRWHTTELWVAVALDGTGPELLERRRVVADQDGLRELDLDASLPMGRDADAGVFYGGTVVDRRLDRGLTLALPRALSRGESHDLAVRFRLPALPEPRPRLVWVPTDPCELFELRVRFRPDRAPARVWMLHGASDRDLAQPGGYGRQQPVDQAGEIHVCFRQLTPGLAYGVQW